MSKKSKLRLLILFVCISLMAFGGKQRTFSEEMDTSETGHPALSDSIQPANCQGTGNLWRVSLLSSYRLNCYQPIFPLQPGRRDTPFVLEMKFHLSSNPLFRPAEPAYTPRNLQFSLDNNRRRINYTRAAIMGTGSVAYIYFGLKHAMNAWGKSNGRFHIKHDWTGDHLAQTDELSHFTWGYKMTQFCFWMYDWIGLSPRTGELVSVIESALILTIVEFPVDAYNPQQGLGVSDLIFDYMGVGLALARKHHGFLRDFDVKVSWKRNLFATHHPAFSQTFGEFDNFIFWLTYRPHLLIPRRFLCLGLGYSATHRGIEPQREIYGGLGLSVSDFFGLLGKKFKSSTEFLDLLYPNFKLKL
jgi:hypothetical protein